jgi:glycosyltransferase involved in cell wall biosynthesis
MPEALLLTPVAPDALGVGPARRAHQWLTRLSRTHQVRVLVVRPPGPHAPAPAPGCYQAPWPALGRRLTHLLGLVLLVGRRVPPQDWVALTPALRDWLDGELAGARLERIVCFRLYLAEVGAYVASRHPAAATTLDLDDLEAPTRRSIAVQLFRDGRWGRGALVAAGLSAWRDRERRWGARFDQVTVCCEQDRDTASRGLPGRDVQVFPNRIWRGALRPTGDVEEPRLVLFVGALAYAPNESAVLFFAREVMPRLLADDPAWRFAVVGRGGSPALRERLARCPGVVWVGEVPEVTPWYARCAMVVAPLRAGGGTKLKVLEALCHERPLVATHEATRGLALRDGQHYVAAESAADFAAACRRLAAEPALGLAIAAEGRAHAWSHYTYGEDEDA